METRKDPYGDNHYQEHYLEQYKIYLEMLERSTQRRIDTNTLFISINTAMITLYSLFNKGNAQAVPVVALTGILFSLVWFSLLWAYNTVNKAKWRVVEKMEENLPCNPFHAEWNDSDTLGQGMKDKKIYFPISWLERFLPVIFLIVYVVLWLNQDAENPANLANLVAALEDAVSDLTAALAEITRSGIGG